MKGNRRDHYIADRDIWKIATGRLKVGLEHRISEANTAIEQTEEMLNNSNGKFNGEDKKLASTYMERIADVRKMSSRLARVLKLLST